MVCKCAVKIGGYYSNLFILGKIGVNNPRFAPLEGDAYWHSAVYIEFWIGSISRIGSVDPSSQAMNAEPIGHSTLNFMG